MRIFAIVLVFASLSLLVSARFGQEEKPRDIKKLEKFNTGDGDVNGFLGDISGTCIDSLVAAAPPCSMQDQCDIIMDVAKNFLRGNRQKALIAIARRLIVSEKNTPENGLRSKRCNKKPRHKELRGLFPKQDPTGSAKTKSKPPFVPKKFTKIRKFVLKRNGKIIAPTTKRD
jgi:hypothetical protein